MKRRDGLLRGASGKALVIVVIRVIVTLLLAVLANFALDESSALGQGHHLWDDKYDRPTDLFVLGAAVLWLVILLIQALVGSIAVTIAVTLTLTGLVALANYKKMLLRGEPVYPSDLRFAGDPGFLKDMVGPAVVVEFLVGLCRHRRALCGAGLAQPPADAERAEVPGSPGLAVEGRRAPDHGARLCSRAGLRGALQLPGQRSARHLRGTLGATWMPVEPAAQLPRQQVRRRLPLQPSRRRR